MNRGIIIITDILRDTILRANDNSKSGFVWRCFDRTDLEVMFGAVCIDISTDDMTRQKSAHDVLPVN